MTATPRGNNPDTGKQEMPAEWARNSVGPTSEQDPGVAHNDRAPDPQPDRFYRFGRIGRWFGRFVGGAGRRTGARDTDPGV